jgi:hypothetical protein
MGLGNERVQTEPDAAGEKLRIDASLPVAPVAIPGETELS